MNESAEKRPDKLNPPRESVKIVSAINCAVLLAAAVIDAVNLCLWQKLVYSSARFEMFLWRSEGVFGLLLIPGCFLAQLLVMLKLRKTLNLKIVLPILLFAFDVLIGLFNLALVGARF